MFDNADIFCELVKYLSFKNKLNLQKVCQFSHHLITQMIDNVQEDRFLKDNNIAVVTKIYELRTDYQFDKDKMLKLPNFRFVKKNRWKHGVIRYSIGDLRIVINVENKLLVSGCKSHNNAYHEISRFLCLLNDADIIDSIIDITKLNERYTVAEFEGTVYSKRIKNSNLSYKLTYNKNLFYDIYQNEKIRVSYSNFTEFYMTYNCINSKINSKEFTFLFKPDYYHMGSMITYYNGYNYTLTYGAYINHDTKIMEPFREFIPSNFNKNKHQIFSMSKYIGIEFEHNQIFEIENNQIFEIENSHLHYNGNLPINITSPPNEIINTWREKYPHCKAKCHVFVKNTEGQCEAMYCYEPH